MTHTAVLNNSAFEGGAVFIHNDRYAEINFIDSDFSDNIAESAGRVLYVHARYNVNLTVENCNITENKARFGGVLHVKDYNFLFCQDNIIITMAMVSLAGNSVQLDGGVLFLYQCKNNIIEIIQSTFTGKTAGRNVAVVYSYY